jgi:hypothetical protein
MKKIYQVLFSLLIFSSLQAKPATNPYANKSNLTRFLLTNKDKVHGWCSNEKSTKMLDLVLETKPEVCVEIGVFGGSSIFPTALGLKYNKKGTVYAIDPWSNAECIEHHRDGDPNKKFWGTIDLNLVYNLYTNMISNYKLNNHVKTLKMTSEAALSVIPSTIDILHIDGNHQEEACYFDTVNFFPRVKVGGYIWFDDAGWYDNVQKIHTTKKSFDYLLEFCELVTFVDKKNCYLLRRIK